MLVRVVDQKIYTPHGCNRAVNEITTETGDVFHTEFTKNEFEHRQVIDIQVTKPNFMGVDTFILKG